MNQSVKFKNPIIDAESEYFWQGADEKKLRLKTCNDCQKTHYHPRSHCPFCFSSNTDWIEAKGTGIVYSFSTMRRVETPYTIAYVELEEGPKILTNIVNCPPNQLHIGQPVKLTFLPSENGQLIPVFEPAKHNIHLDHIISSDSIRS